MKSFINKYLTNFDKQTIILLQNIYKILIDYNIDTSYFDLLIPEFKKRYNNNINYSYTQSQNRTIPKTHYYLEILNEKITKEELFRNYYKYIESLRKAKKYSRNEFYLGIYDNPFISPQILEEIETKMNYKFKIKNTFNANIYVYSQDINQIDNYVKKILNIMNIFNYNYSNRTFVFYLTDSKKEITKETDYLTPNEVNSGSTIRDNIIIIWRKEELEKVFIHELMHYNHIDFDTNFELDYFNIIDHTKEIKYNEAYTEIIAIIYYCIYNACKLEITTIKELLNLELNFSLVQCARIYQHNNWNEYECLFKKYNKCKSMIQYSNVFSYYIIKTAIIYNISDLVVSLKKTNKYKYNKNIKFDMLIKNSLINKNFIKLMNKLIKNYNFNFKSLRMSLITFT